MLPIFYLTACSVTSGPGMPQFIEHTGGDGLLIVRPEDVGPPFPSPFGPISRRAAYVVCASPNFRIGTVQDVEPTYINSYFANGSSTPDLYSELTMDEERTIYGDPAVQFGLLVPGGVDGSVHLMTPPLYPQPTIGDRYAVAYSEVKNPGNDPLEFPDGSSLIWATFTIDPAVALPPSSVLIAAVDEFCTGLP